MTVPDPAAGAAWRRTALAAAVPTLVFALGAVLIPIGLASVLLLVLLVQGLVFVGKFIKRGMG